MLAKKPQDCVVSPSSPAECQPSWCTTSPSFQHAVDTFHASGVVVIPNALPAEFAAECHSTATKDLAFLREQLEQRKQEASVASALSGDTWSISNACNLFTKAIALRNWTHSLLCSEVSVSRVKEGDVVALSHEALDRDRKERAQVALDCM